MEPYTGAGNSTCAVADGKGQKRSYQAWRDIAQANAARET